MMRPLTILQQSSTGSWDYESKTSADIAAQAFQYILVEDDVFSITAQPAPELVQSFHIPSHLLTDAYLRSNGFYSSAESLAQNDGAQHVYTWFRVLVKIAARDAQSYTWHEMTFCSRWSPTKSAMLCIGASALFQKHLQQALVRLGPMIPSSEPFALHVPLVEALVAMHDASVWSIRDIVRSIEKDRSSPGRGLHSYVMMHEAARHAIHSYETLSVTAETIEAMQQHLTYISSQVVSSGKSDPKYSQQLQTRMDVQIRMLRNFVRRSQSNRERLQNEIALAYNMNAQRDSGAMRTIAVVTMAFLPPTFLSAIFSMSFFEFTPDEGSAGWAVSDRFWVYWVCAVPLTCLTMTIWYMRLRQA